jgi:NosR/NirI family nitrous oxide reductase transcriptional regulator
MKARRLIIGVLAILSLTGGLFFRQETAVDEGAALRELAPAAVFSNKTGNPPHYQAASGEVAFNTYDIVPSARGYSGPIKVMIVLGPDGRIKALKIIEHRETRNYVHYLETPAYLGGFIGKSVLDRFEVDRDIDGISRATVSVEALALTVRDASRTMAERVYGIRAAPGEVATRSGWSWAAYSVLFAAALCGYILTRWSARIQRLRDAVLVLSLVVIGVVLSASFSILSVFNLLLARLSSSTLWYVVLVSSLLSAVIAGRLYCGWLCPFGAVSELLARFPTRKWTIDTTTDDQWRKAKYVLLCIATVAVLLFRRAEYGNYEAYVTLYSFQGNALSWGLVAIALLANLRVPRFWCRYLCPVAAFLGLLSRNAEGYPSSPACPMGNRPDPEIAECIRCNRCYHKSRQN